jgi:hypothetical protein
MMGKPLGRHTVVSPNNDDGTHAAPARNAQRFQDPVADQQISWNTRRVDILPVLRSYAPHRVESARFATIS